MTTATTGSFKGSSTCYIYVNFSGSSDTLLTPSPVLAPKSFMKNLPAMEFPALGRTRGLAGYQVSPGLMAHSSHLGALETRSP